MIFERPAPRARQLPIVSMIDILFIVLIFFIVSSEFKTKRPVVQIQLPTSREVPAELVSGERSVLAVTADGKVRIDDLEVPDLGLLGAYLQSFVKKNPDRKLELEADKGVSLEQLFGVRDALTKAGLDIKDVPVRTELPGGIEE
ncbi:biopolymer transport protein ExbD [Haloferula luteola]|uniref:Biopolymer transport protein ExbD n=1 Tax=Haloferula luteola TaxID=595692 RepID=A0A840V6N0_9BACT|nr:biopolymer transporter ExbD [Haloferula luteola]MBB5353323.1 biopolymer transport protein ExbD [Haloferula luteola]